MSATYSTEFKIKQRIFKDIITFISNSTNEVTIYVKSRPTRMLCFYTQLEEVKEYVCLSDEYTTSFVINRVYNDGRSDPMTEDAIMQSSFDDMFGSRPHVHNLISSDSDDPSAVRTQTQTLTQTHTPSKGVSNINLDAITLEEFASFRDRDVYEYRDTFDIIFSTYVSNLLSIIKTFNKTDNILVTLTDKIMKFSVDQGRVFASIKSVCSIINRIPPSIDTLKIALCLTCEVREIGKFFKIVALIIRQERSHIHIQLDKDQLIFSVSALECSFLYSIDITYKNQAITVDEPTLNVNTLVINRFRNIKNLTESLNLSIYKYRNIEYCLVLHSNETKNGLEFFISIPLTTQNY